MSYLKTEMRDIVKFKVKFQIQVQNMAGSGDLIWGLE
jgi:hypothetical protein